MIMVSVYPQCVVRMMRISLLDVLEGREVLVLVPSLKPSVVGEEGEQETVREEGRGGRGVERRGVAPSRVLLLQSMFFSHWVEGGRTPFLNPGGLWCTFSCCCPGPNQTPMISLLFHGNGWLVIRGRQGCDTINWKTVKIFDVCQEF